MHQKTKQITSKMERRIFVRNQFGIKVKKCCASCAFKDLKRAVTKRYCKEHARSVNPSVVCERWKMSNLLKQVGKTQGDVRDKDTKEVLF